MRVRYVVLIALLAIMSAGCSGAGTPEDVSVVQLQTSEPTLTDTAPPSATLTATATATSTATATPTATATATATPTPTATPDPYAGLTIEDLRARAYGGGEITVHETLAVTAAFTRLLISYPSDGLEIYGFLNVPVGEGPFPVAIVLHGYIDPQVYATLAYTTRYADTLARAGYVTFHPNLRGYPPSDDGPNAFRVGMAVDVLNLLAIIREQAGAPGLLEAADASAIGMMGHSMGGGITWRVLTVDRGVGAAVLYGSMHADERINYEQVKIWSGGQRGHSELATPEQDLARISAATYLQDIVAPISIHHSIHDGTVPYEWSEDLAARMEELDRPVELFLYQNTPHTFSGAADALFMERIVTFFDTNLK